jgi:hypothetical protein
MRNLRDYDLISFARKPLAVFVAAYLSHMPLAHAQQKDYLDPANAPLSSQAAAATTDILFDVTVPNSVFRTITVPAGSHADIEIFARDCCIRDDNVVIFLGGCQVATVDSRGGDYGTHPGETHTSNSKFAPTACQRGDVAVVARAAGHPSWSRTGAPR